MAWIEVHQNLERHPKVLMLRKKSGLPLDTVLGRVLQLWLWGLDYAWDGDLRKYDAGMVEEACNIPLSTLIEVGLVDRRPYLRLHDWWDYAGHYIKTKYKNYPEKWERIKKSYETKLGNPKNTLRRLTNQPNQPNQPTNPGPDILFEDFWKEYPRKIGKPEAQVYFKASIKNEVDFNSLMVAVRNYKADIVKNDTQEKYIKHGSSFLSKERWKDWVNYGTNNSASSVDLKAEFRAKREAEKARTVASPRALPAVLRDSEDVSDGEGR